jgi:hypothetical protein
VPVLHILLLLVALVCFGFAAWQHGSPVWNRVVAIGLMFLTASMVPW